MFALWVALTVLCLLEAVVSIYLNLGIVFIYTRSWMKRPKLNPSSLIHLVMGANNFTMRFSRIVDDLCPWLPGMFESGFYKITVVLLGFNLYFSYWLTAWLCAYYCLIITNLSHQLVVSIKRILSAYLPYWLCLTGVWSLAIAVVYFYFTEMDTLVQHDMGNTLYSISTENDNITSIYTFLAASLGSGLPFIRITFFLLVTVVVLLKHAQHMGNTGSNVQVHITTIQTMVLFFIASTLFLICDLNIVINSYNDNDLMTVISWYVIALFPTLEAIIIIHASPKLKKIFPFCAGGILGRLRTCLG
uniref:Taste receptor type 2 n=2 Tax=Pyxicephalus adspersus TaxID=30357 RepID=A0AAV2ZWV0_PYXAD|nr:TPA: hypothetical protein GDO54_014774 [Pyxicephalus adspersus]